MEGGGCFAVYDRKEEEGLLPPPPLTHSALLLHTRTHAEEETTDDHPCIHPSIPSLLSFSALLRLSGCSLSLRISLQRTNDGPNEQTNKPDSRLKSGTPVLTHSRKGGWVIMWGGPPA